MEKSSSYQKFFGLFLIMASLTAVTFLWTSKPPNNNKLNSNTKKTKVFKAKSEFQSLWEKDIKEMVKDELFHKEISSLKKVRIFLLDENLHRHFKGLSAPFKFHQNGQNLLEVSFMSHHSENEGTDKLVVQYNLIDKDSGNMFWEHSRTINLKSNVLQDE